MQGRLTLVAVVLALAVAGCVQPAPGDLQSETDGPSGARDALTEPTLAFGEFLALKIAAPDGVELHVDIQLPEGEGPFPTLIEYTPYSMLGGWDWGLASEHDRRDLAPFGLAERYVPRGYAVGIAHVRGTGESGGCLTVGGPNEGTDGYAIVEGIASQPWSNGKVALMGTSYVGTTPIETAVLAPPHLTTIIPVAAVTNWYRYYFENGEQRMNGSPPPGASYPDPAFWMALGVAPGLRTGAASPDDAACVAEYWREFWLQDDLNAFWKARDHGAMASQIQASVLYVQGFDDENVATNMITEWWHNVTAPKRAWFQQHAHGIPGSFEAYYEYEHRWLDHWMLGKDNGAMDLPDVVVQDQRGEYRTEAAWPPADAAPMRWWLASGGALVNETHESGKVSFLDDGVGDMRAQKKGQTWLEFVSDPLETPILIAGEPVMHLVAASDQTDTQFTILVYDVAPDGSERFVTRGYLDARHRNSLEKGEDLKPGEVYAFHWELHPRDHYVDAGHALRVVVKSSDPYIIPDNVRATNTVFLGEEGSWIELLVVDPSTRAFSDAPARPASWS